MVLMKKDKIISLLVEEFREKGFAGVSLTSISNTTNLGKSTLYHHFPSGKTEMVMCVINKVRDWIQKELVANLMNFNKSQEKLNFILDQLSLFYNQGKSNCIIDAISIESGSSIINDEVKKVLLDLLQLFENLAIERGCSKNDAKEKSEKILCLIQGSLILSRTMKDESFFQKQIIEIKKSF